MRDDDEDTGVDLPKATCKRETDKAILVNRGKGDMWVPKSVIHDDSEVYGEGHEGTLIVKYWWAEEKNLI